DHEFTGEYQEHPFDNHQIMSNYNTSPKAHDALKHDDYLKAWDAFHDEGGGLDSYFDLIDTRDPEKAKLRGTIKHPGVHKDIEGLSLEDIKDKVEAVPATPE